MTNYDRSKLEGRSGFDLFMFETFDDPDNIKNKIFGFQFHPDSFLTKNGKFLIQKILSA